MPVPSAITDLSQTAGSNSPAGSESPTTADDYFRTYASFIALLRDGKGFSSEVDVASGATTDIGAANSMFVRITGTTTITSFGTNYNGPRALRFADALTLTHNATTLVLPGGANITTAAGDSCVVVPISGGWAVSNYQRAVVATARSDLGFTSAVVDRKYDEHSSFSGTNSVIPLDDSVPQVTEGDELFSVSITPKSASNRLRLRAVINGANDTTNAVTTVALFTSASASAIQAVPFTQLSANALQSVTVETEIAPATTSALTITVRVGVQSALHGFRFNGNASGRFMGGCSRCTFVVEEITA